jgi:hypothetical protein
MVEVLRIIMHRPSALLQIYELFMLPFHDACQDVRGIEGITELGPQNLIVRRASGGVIGPPRASISP